MFLAPRLPLEKRRRGRIRFILTGIFLWLAALAFSAVALVLTAANYFLIDPQVSPLEMYHRTWEAVRDNIYDQSRLEDWDSWKHKYDDRIETVEDAVRYAREMVASIGDPYTYLQDAESVAQEYRDAEAKVIGVGIILQPILDQAGNPVLDPDGQHSLATTRDGCAIIQEPVRGGPAHKAGIVPGDVLVSVDGLPTRGMTRSELSELLRGEPGTTVNLLVRRDGVEIELSLERAAVSIPTVSTRLLPDGIGYLRIEGFSQLDTADQVREGLLELSECRALVVDVRNNPGGLIHTAVLSAAMFMDSGVVAHERMRIPGGGYLNYSVELTPRFMLIRVAGIPIPLPRPANLAGNRPVVVLVDGNTASAAETFASALQDNGRARLVGARSFGKGVGQMLIPVGNGARVRVTNFYGFTPSGLWLGDGHRTRQGIQPDVVIHPVQRLLFASGNDNQLSAAVEYLRQQFP